MRGDLYRLRTPREVRVTSNRGPASRWSCSLTTSPLATWLVAPTSTGRRPASFRPEIEIDGVTTRVMLEQLTVVDPQVRLGDFAGRLDAAEMRAVDEALLAVLGLD